MALLHVVNMPKSRQPVFPDLCIVCQRNQAKTQVNLASHSLGWWLLFTLKFGDMTDVRVPACGDCTKLLDRDRLGRWIATAGIAIVGIVILIRLLGSHVSPAHMGFLMFIGLLCLLPLIVWQWKTPLPIEVTSYQDSIDYTFVHEGYAMDFAKLNGVSTIDPWIRRNTPL